MKRKTPLRLQRHGMQFAMKRVNAAIPLLLYSITVFISSSSAAYILHPKMAIKRRSSTRNSTKTSSSLAGSNNSSSYENNNNNDGNKQNKKQKVVTAIKRKSHWTRPGVEAAARLVSLPPLSSSSSSSFPSLLSEQITKNDTVKSWNMALSYYTTMLKVKGGTKLYNLDQQRDVIRKQWKLNINNSSSSNNKVQGGDDDDEEVLLTKDQLLNIIIPWKFLKGKPRNALKPLLQSNSEEEVKRCSMAAFKFANKLVDENNSNSTTTNNNEQYIQESIQSICNLKGVGPATASAILSIYNPKHFCFMDDEVIECLYDKKRGYTLKIYMEVNECCAEIARLLNDCSSCGEGGGKGGGEGNESWTPASVGKALWTVATMSAQNDEEGLNKVFND
jgi:hypothetical protein